MARIEIYGNDSNVTLDDKVIGTDALDNSTKNFTVGSILALASGGGVSFTAGTGIDISNGVISSTTTYGVTFSGWLSGATLNLLGTDGSQDFVRILPGSNVSMSLAGEELTISSTDTNDFVSNVVLNGTNLDFTGTGGAFQSSVPLSSIADQTVTLAGTGGIAITGTYPSFTIDGSAISGGGTTYTAGTGIDITNNVISSTVVDTDTNTTYDFGAVSVSGNINFALGGSDNSNDVVTMQAGSKITLTDNGSSVFTVDHGIISTTKTTNTTALAFGGTFKAIDAVTYSDGHLTEYNEKTYTLPTGAPPPETLILRFASTDIPIEVSPGQALVFEPIGQLTKTNSLHINPVDLLLADPSTIAAVNARTAKVSLGAYINNGGQSGQITFEILEDISGTITLLGSASFDMSNQAVSAIPTTFLSFFDFQQNASYIFTAYSTQHQMAILPGSFIQIEILK